MLLPSAVGENRHKPGAVAQRGYRLGNEARTQVIVAAEFQIETAGAQQIFKSDMGRLPGIGEPQWGLKEHTVGWIPHITQNGRTRP